MPQSGPLSWKRSSRVAPRSRPHSSASKCPRGDLTGAFRRRKTRLGVAPPRPCTRAYRGQDAARRAAGGSGAATHAGAMRRRTAQEGRRPAGRRGPTSGRAIGRAVRGGRSYVDPGVTQQGAPSTGLFKGTPPVATVDRGAGGGGKVADVAGVDRVARATVAPTSAAPPPTSPVAVRGRGTGTVARSAISPVPGTGVATAAPAARGLAGASNGAPTTRTRRVIRARVAGLTRRIRRD